MMDAVSRIALVARELSDRLPLEVMLQLVVERAAEILGAPHASLRLFDTTRTRLIANCRWGQPLHRGAGAEFRVGEGLLGWIAEHNCPLRTGDAAHDARYIHRPGQIATMGSFLGAPLTSNGECFGVIAVVHPDRDAFDASHEQLLMLLAGLCAPHLELARIHRLAAHDPLTGILNRRGLDFVLPDEGYLPVSVALCDIDRFKAINDGLGHAMGDRVLQHIARLLQSVLRAGDTVVRWGGEEFLLVLPNAELGRAQRIVERARSWIEREELEIEGRPLQITTSAGVAERHLNESREALIARADEALYVAKHSGRNRVESAA